MAAEIAEQPEMFARLLRPGAPEVRAIANQIRAANPRFVVLAARGTSDHAALYGKYLVEIELGLPAGLASPSSLTAYGAKPNFTDVLWVAVSQSGGSPDLVESTAAARRAGALTLAVTNAPESPLAAAAQLHLDVGAGAEGSVAATKSYTAELLTLWLLVDGWRGGDGHAAEVLPQLASTVLQRRDDLVVADRYRFVEKIVTTARGYAYPTAREASLKLMETSYLSAHAFSGADLLHGPLAMIDQDRPVICIVPEGVGGQAMQPVLERLRERHADLCIVGDARFATGDETLIALPPGLPEQLSPILQIIPLQRLALTMALARHHDPDAPRGLRKITQTW